jgi:hypothetical protein
LTADAPPIPAPSCGWRFYADSQPAVQAAPAALSGGLLAIKTIITILVVITFLIVSSAS